MQRFDDECEAEESQNDDVEFSKREKMRRKRLSRGSCAFCSLILGSFPERVAMMISGDEPRAVFDRYNIASQSDLKDAAHPLGRYSRTKTNALWSSTQPAHKPNGRPSVEHAGIRA